MPPVNADILAAAGFNGAPTRGARPRLSTAGA